jgi:hypothetical protein
MLQIIRDHYTQKSRGFGFVTYQDAKSAEAALNQMHGKVSHVNERALKMTASSWAVEAADLGSSGFALCKLSEIVRSTFTTFSHAKG